MIIMSTQGFVISLPYCFLNSEVQGVVKNHWSRWRMVRTVGKNTTRANSVSTNATYYINQKTGVPGTLKCLVVEEENSKKEEETIFQEIPRSTKTGTESHIFGIRQSLIN